MIGKDIYGGREMTIVAIVSAVLNIVLILVATHHWHRNYQIAYLISKGWKMSHKRYLRLDGVFRWVWEAQASDETCKRPLKEAYNRQKLLDHRSYYNLPSDEPKQVEAGSWR